MFAFFDMILEFFKRLKQLIANETVGGYFKFKLVLQSLITFSLPFLHFQAFKFCLLR